ncbi:MAG: RICIN domain-containing protein [Bacteroidales bacterium]|nr:RICIN domain-containing protein [Bacteroidales bacterium]
MNTTQKNFLFRLLVIIILLNPCFIFSEAQQPAFPGAEGFGRYATGGRGGTVYHVTNLNDAGTGSFRDAVSQPNRIVVFEVGGVINIASRIVVSPNITIAGQTAPGDGITIYGNGLSFSGADNTICRYLRVRMGKNGDDEKDAVTIANGSTMIFDHVSVSWGRDENFSVSWDNKGVEPENITIQNSIIGQGLQTHSCGGLIQTAGGVSLLRNLYVDNNTRNPKVKGKNQFVNNIIYNWGSDGYILGDSEGQSYANVTGNYFINGPSTSGGAFTRGNTNFNIYADDNYQDNNKNGVLDGALLTQAQYTTVTWVTTPFDYPVPTSMTPLEAYNHVVANAGATLPIRDQVDQRLLEEVTSLGTIGQLISDETAAPMSGPGLVKGGAANIDTDRDGMPDIWEMFYGLNPYSNADQNLDYNSDGYTNIEEYLNNTDPGKGLGIINDTTYFVYASHSNMVLDIKDKEITENTSIIQNSFEKTSRQIWKITYLDSVFYSIINDSSKLCLDVKGASLLDSAEIVQTAFTGAESQQWILEFLGEGLYKITNRKSGKSLDVKGASNDNGAVLIQNAFNDNNHQKFKFMPGYLAYKKPFVNITMPLGGSTYTRLSDIDIEAYAGDEDGTIVKVEFYDGTTKLGTDSIAPYQSQIKDAAEGVHQVSAIAWDNEGFSAQSTKVLVEVMGAGSSPCTIQEDTTGFCSLEGTVDNNHGGFTGDGFSNTTNAVGAGINWKVDVFTETTYTLTWRYANGSGSRPGKLLVNGQEKIASIDMPVTGAWTTWAVVSVQTTLPEGILDIRLEGTTSNGLANIDFFEVSGDSTKPASCLPSAITGNEINTFSYYPNPFTDEINIELTGSSTGICKVELYTLLGERIYSNEFSNKTHKLNVYNTPTGTYILKIQLNDEVITRPVIKY